MSEQGLTREQLTVELYGGEDYRVYDGTRLIATVYAEDDLIWLLDRDAQQLERLEDCKESERVADIRFYEIKHLKAELEQVKRERDRWYGAAQERQIETNILQQQLAEANKTMSGAWESMGNFSKRIEELKHEIDLRDSQLAAREGQVKALENVLQWYSSRAEDIARYMATKKTDAQIAVMAELSLDAGKRAQALKPNA